MFTTSNSYWYCKCATLFQLCYNVIIIITLCSNTYFKSFTMIHYMAFKVAIKWHFSFKMCLMSHSKGFLNIRWLKANKRLKTVSELWVWDLETKRVRCHSDLLAVKFTDLIIYWVCWCYTMQSFINLSWINAQVRAIWITHALIKRRTLQIYDSLDRFSLLVKHTWARWVVLEKWENS